MLIGLMSLKNQVVYVQFHPVAYMVKLNIEMSMARLITKLARGTIQDRNNEFMIYSSSQNNTHNTAPRTAIGMKSGVHSSVTGNMRSGVKGEDGDDFEGIRTLKEVDVVVERRSKQEEGFEGF